MTIDKTVTIRELARAIPTSVRFFEKVEIDYCCGGGESLEEACQGRKLALETVIASLETLSDLERLSPSSVDWNSVSLTELISHVVDTHHATVQRELPRLKQLIDKMCIAHAEKRPGFLQVQDLIEDLVSDPEEAAALWRQDLVDRAQAQVPALLLDPAVVAPQDRALAAQLLEQARAARSAAAAEEAGW